LVYSKMVFPMNPIRITAPMIKISELIFITKFLKD